MDNNNVNEVLESTEIEKEAILEGEQTENVQENAQEAPAAPVDTRDYELRVSDEELAKKKRRAEIWDKITTGILILLMASPILILGYIFLWFMLK